MPYYAPSAYYPLPSTQQAASQLPQPQQQQYSAPVAQVDQVYLRQQAQAQAQAQQIAYQQQQQAQLQQQQYIEQQNRQIAAQQQYYQQQQQLQQQQYAAQQQRQQQQQYAQQNFIQQQQQYQQQQTTPSRQQQRSGYQPSPVCQQSATPLYKSSEYVQSGGVYATGGAYNQPSLRRVPSRADVNTAVENQEAPLCTFGQGPNTGRVSQYNPYANYGQTVAQSPIRPASQREPSQYAFDGLNPSYKQQQQYSQERDLPTAREQLSASNAWIGARSLNAPTTVVLDANNNAAPLAPRSPARTYSTPQRGYGNGGAQAESAYISIPNNLVYAQSDQQRAYNYACQESRPVYGSSSRTNQIAAPSPLKLKPAAARELYAALSSENVRTALERDAPVTLLQSTPAYSTYNGQKVTGRAFVVPADQKYSEYTLNDLNGLRSVIDAPLR